MTSEISFPASLPPVQLSGASLSLSSQTIRSENSQGPAKVRRRTSSNVLPLNGSLKITQEQCNVLEEFYNTTTSGGALPFVMTDPVKGILAEYRFVGPPTLRPLTPRTSPAFMLEAQISLEQLPPLGGIVIVSAGPTCELILGGVGVAQFSTSSEITIESRAFCVSGSGVVSNEDTETIVCAYARTNTEDGDNVSVDWEYTDANGTTIVTFHKDDGWSYSIDADHAAEPSASCGSGTAYTKLTGDESQFPGFRDFSIPALDDTNAKTLCSVNGLQFVPVFYRLAVVGTLSDNGSCGTPASRAQGFRDYLWACSSNGGVNSGSGEQISLE